MLRKTSKGNRRVDRKVGRERGRTSGLWRRLGRTALTAAVVGGVAAGLPLAGYAGYRAVLESGYFAPTNVQVHGNSQVTTEEIVRAAGLDRDGVNLIDLEASDLESRIASLEWIAEVEVETKLPDTVEITVRERELLGVIRDERLYTVDLDGEVIAAVLPGATLPAGTIVTGTGLSSGGPMARELVRTGFAIVSLYEAMGLERFARLGEVHHNARLGWTLFAEETEVRLGDDRPRERLERLWQVFTLLEREGTRAEYVLLDLDDALDRVAVRPYPRVVAATPAPSGDEVDEGADESGSQ